MKHLFLPIVLLMSLLLPATSQAYDFEVDGIYYDINGNEATVARSPNYNYSGDVVIPSSVTYQGTTRTVTAIGNRAFVGCYVSSVSMPNTILEIDERAFYYCENLTSVTIPNSVVTIGQMAFYYCPAMTSAIIGNSVTTIGAYAFYFCENLTNLTLSNSVTTIGDYAFGSDRSLTSVSIPASVTTIGSNAFTGCSGLERVEITDLAAWCNIDFGSINANPLYYAQHLYMNGSEVTNLTIPNTITQIKKYAFRGCLGLTSVTIPYGVTVINSYSFTECRNLTSVNIPNSVTKIGYYAFSECNSLQSIMIPASVTSIESGAFDATWTVESIVVNSDNPVYDSRDNCNAIIETATNTLIEGCKNTVIPNTVTTIAYLAFSYRYSLTSINIPNSVTTIESQAFLLCTGLTSFHVPASVVEIGAGAFQGCSSLTNLTVASDNPVFDSRDNCNAVIETATDMLVVGCQSSFVPNTVKKIGAYAFNECKHLTVMDIPDGVTSIGQSAFEECEELRSLYIPATVTEIGNWAFADCMSLNEVYCDIPDPSAIWMGTYVFARYGENGYDYNGRVLHVPAGTVEAYQADSRWSEFFERIVENTPAGDVDGNGHVTITDVTALIDLLLSGNTSLADHPGADVDNNGQININDVTVLIDILLAQ